MCLVRGVSGTAQCCGASLVVTRHNPQSERQSMWTKETGLLAIVYVLAMVVLVLDIFFWRI